jgi:hypothetical protein
MPPRSAYEALFREAYARQTTKPQAGSLLTEAPRIMRSSTTASAHRPDGQGVPSVFNQQGFELREPRFTL